MSKKLAAVIALSAASSLAQAASYCYTLLDRAGRVVVQSSTSPIDLSRRISDVLAERHPGHHFVFGLADSCPEIAAPVASGRGRSEAARAASVAALLGRYPDVSQRSDGTAATTSDGERGGAVGGTGNAGRDAGQAADAAVRASPRGDGGAARRPARDPRAGNR